jgi:23S rRNA (adenine2030-N6)-methyltransferase
MLSYLHAYHAGSHADVLKHVVLLAILAELTTKDKPLRYVDTHAGAGGYSLRSREARKNREFETGIAKLWDARDPPPPVAALIGHVRAYNGDGAPLARYPGSPWLACERLRRGDSAYFFDLHPAEHRALAKTFAADRRVTVLRRDGLLGCIGLVPPPERRALVFVDPSYELENEHEQVVDALGKAHRRFARGVYAIWYPVIDRPWVKRFERALLATRIAPLELFELSVLTGSGIVIVNPPWKLRHEMQRTLPWLASTLAPDGAGAHRSVALRESAEAG